jgi:hypothetical protein
MPEEKFSDEEIAVLVEWVQQGAVDPRDIEPQKPDLKDAADWWSLKPLIASRDPAFGGGHRIAASHRSFHPGEASSQWADTISAGRSSHTDQKTVDRSAWSASFDRRRRRLRQRSCTGCLRATGGSYAGVTSLWRTLGTALDGHDSLCGYSWIRT